jgi:hypothetical protein
MARPDSDPEGEKEEARCIQALRALLKTSVSEEEEAVTLPSCLCFLFGFCFGSQLSSS